MTINFLGISFAELSHSVVTKSDIEKHNSEGEGKWLIINGKVYDVEQLSIQVSYFCNDIKLPIKLF